MATPTRLDEFPYREFHVVLAQIGNQVHAVARDHQGKKVEEVANETADGARVEIKQRLNYLSQNFVTVEGAINLFRKAFPGGFESQFYKSYERNYKDRTARFMSEKLARENLDGLLTTGEHEVVSLLAKQALGTSNLFFPNEQMALSDALKNKGVTQPFAEGLRELIYGDSEAALEGLTRLLKPHGAAKWPILTFWPFFRFPDHHTFLKPTIAQNCAERMGYDLQYESLPNAETYRSMLGFTTFLRKGIADLKPKDNIDIQTFMYAVGKEGYVRDAIKDRERRGMT